MSFDIVFVPRLDSINFWNTCPHAAAPAKIATSHPAAGPRPNDQARRERETYRDRGADDGPVSSVLHLVSPPPDGRRGRSDQGAAVKALFELFGHPKMFFKVRKRRRSPAFQVGIVAVF